MNRNDKAHGANFIYLSTLRSMWMRNRRGDRQGYLGWRAFSSGHVLTRTAVMLGLMVAVALSACTPARLAVKGTGKIITAPVKIIF
ncbi:hypothetical protein N9381_00315 [Paracoccaceae bacterium]|jgi:hypothetical protein|nr:hypothetical protein [Paracoccaceae bacterium]MDB3910247.1 hypothetical protein [Paracoccaceae bacterium]